MKRYLIELAMAGLILFIPFGANALCTKSKTNLRSGPGSKYPISWEVSRYTPLIEVKRQGSWIEVQDMDGEIHWVFANSVTTRMVCVAVSVPSAKLHTGPGSSELADIRQVDRHTPFKRVDDKDGWYEVEASWGETYWIHENTVWRPIKVANINF